MQSEQAGVEFKKLSHYQSRIPGHRSDSRCHLSTLIRWAVKGVKTQTGEVVRLRAIRLGAKWVSTDEWFSAFTAALTASSIPADSPPIPAPRSPSKRARDAARVDKRLDEILA